jgi:hypothetical protein
VSAVPEDVRSRAQEARDRLETGAAAAGVAAAASGLTGVGAPLAAPLALIGAVMGGVSLVARRWAEDPPRRDFAVGTQVRIRQPRLDLVPESPIAAVARDCAYWLTFSRGYLVAALRAFEREQGAVLASADEMVRARRSERIRYARSAAEGLRGAAGALERLAPAIARLQTGDVPASSLPRTVEELPDWLLAWLYRAAIRIESSERLVELMAANAERVASSQRRVAAIGELPAALIAFAQALEAWRSGPAARPRGGPRQPELFED